jgi:hypothetical protein
MRAREAEMTGLRTADAFFICRSAACADASRRAQVRRVRSKSLAAGIVLMLIGLCGDCTLAAEFLPFPKSPERPAAAPPQTTDFTVQFQNSIAALPCATLHQLHDDLLKKAGLATNEADRNYYFRLLGIIDKRASELAGCQAK